MNHSSPSIPLQTALERYQNALNCLTCPNSAPQKSQIIEILSARDALQKQLQTKIQIPTNILSELIKLDADLKKQAYKINSVDLAEYRNSLPTTCQPWLSDLATAQKSHPWHRYEWLLKGAKILILTVNLALFTTLATRFLSGGSDFLEVALVPLPGVLSLLQLHKELTKEERKRFYSFLKEFHAFPNISRLRRTLAIFIASLLSTIFSSYGFLLVFFLFIWYQQPFFAKIYLDTGKTQQNDRNLIVAEQKYLKAIALDSDNFDAHYRLATLYEELQEFGKAQKEYIIAIKGDRLPAYNNLAYWYIRQGKALDAIALLEKSWDLVRERESSESFKQLSPEERLEFKALKYNLAKNFGWAMLEAGQYEDAQNYLEAAIGLANSLEVKPYVRNPGAAHCLYAQLLEKQLGESSRSDRAKEQWQKCKALIQKRLAKEQINTEEYQWLYEARQKTDK